MVKKADIKPILNDLVAVIESMPESNARDALCDIAAELDYLASPIL